VANSLFPIPRSDRAFPIIAFVNQPSTGVPVADHFLPIPRSDRAFPIIASVKQPSMGVPVTDRFLPSPRFNRAFPIIASIHQAVHGCSRGGPAFFRIRDLIGRSRLSRPQTRIPHLVVSAFIILCRVDFFGAPNILVIYVLQLLLRYLSLGLLL